MRVLFVHGMGRTSLSGWPLLWQLRRGGLTTSTFGYCSSFQSFSEIKGRLTLKIIELALEGEYVVIGHSLGGVLLRAAIDSLTVDIRKPCHLFLLASPVKPSRIAIKFGSNLIFRIITGDCGQLLGSDSRMSAISPTSVPKTAIIGVRALPFKTVFSADEINDGIVSLSEVSADWINEQVQVEVLHSFICFSRRVGNIILEKVSLILSTELNGIPIGAHQTNEGIQMTATRVDVVTLATKLFGSEQAVVALSIVDAYGTEAHECEINRVKLAILEVSEGKLSRLPYFVKCAKIDYRDVLIGTKLPIMSDVEEAKWQASADHMLALWNKQ